MSLGGDTGGLAGARLSRAERNRQVLETGHLMADLGERTLRGGAIAMGAQSIRMALQLASAAIMARLLAPEDFGLLAMALVVTGFVGMFTDLGLSAATIQREEIDQDMVSALFFINISMGLLVMLATCAAAPTVAWFFDDGRVSWLVIAMSLIIPLGAAGAQHGALLTRGMRWGTIQWTEIAAQLFGIIVGVTIAWRTDLGYWALVAQAWARGALGLALVWIVCPWRPSRVSNWTGMRSALSFGLNLTGFNFANFFNRQMDNVLIGWRWGAGELGYYNRAYTLLLIPLHLLSGPVASAVIPALSRLQSDDARWRRSLLEAQGALFLASYGLIAAMAAAARPLSLLLFGRGWEEAGQIFFYLAFAMFPATIANTNGWIYISRGQTGRMFKWGLIRLPISLAAFTIGLPYGAVGVAIAFTVAEWCALVPSVWFASHGTPVRAPEVLRRAVSPLLTGALAAGAGLYAGELVSAQNQWLQVAAISVSALTVYLVGVSVILVADVKYAMLRARLMSGLERAFGNSAKRPLE